MDTKSLNPLNLLEKLINEHGSAAIRGDHIALLRDQLIATAKRLSDLDLENSKLKSENANLQEETHALKQRIEELEHRLEELEHWTLSKDHIRILEFLQTTQEMHLDSDIAKSTGLSLLTVQHHLEELRKKQCVSGDFRQYPADAIAGRRTPARWTIEPHGRSVLFEHNQS